MEAYPVTKWRPHGRKRNRLPKTGNSCKMMDKAIHNHLKMKSGYKSGKRDKTFNPA